MFQGVIQLALGVLAVVFQAFAFVDALRQRADAYPATGNQTKTIWLVILGIAVAIGIVLVTNPLSLFNLLAIIAAGVYMTRVRPAIRSITGNGPSTGGW